MLPKWMRGPELCSPLAVLKCASALLALQFLLLLHDRLPPKLIPLRRPDDRLSPGSTRPLSPPLPPCNLTLLSGLLPEGSAIWSSASASSQEDPPPSFLNTPRLSLRHCTLRRFTAHQATACLAHRPIVFIGDSLSRYSFLALASFLHNGRWPTIADHPSIVFRQTWSASVAAFVKGSTEAFQGYMLSDCIGGADMGRSYIHPSRHLNVHFKYWRGWPDKLVGHWGHPPFFNATPCQPPACAGRGCRRAPGECSFKSDYALPLPEALREVVAKLKPAAVIINSGAWRTVETAERAIFDRRSPPGFSGAVVEAAVAAVAAQRGMALWRTTTPSTNITIGASWDAQFLDAAADQDQLRVLDAWRLLRPAMAFQPPPLYDHRHFWPEVYTELHQVLLNMLC